MEFHELWRLKFEDRIESLAFSDDGVLAATSGNCAYLLRDGDVITKVCGKDQMFGASYYSDNFGFVNIDNKVYLVNKLGKLVKKLHVGDECNEAITLTTNGAITCRYKCALTSYNDERLWVTEVGHVPSGPAVKGALAYAADEERESILVLDLKEGEIVEEVDLGEEGYDAKVCGDLLAVGATSTLRLYDITKGRPKEVGRVEGFLGAWSIAFSPDCKRIAVADFSNFALKIYSIEGGLVAEHVYEYPGSEELEGVEPHAVAWHDDKIAVGLRDGTLVLYRVI